MAMAQTLEESVSRQMSGTMGKHTRHGHSVPGAAGAASIRYGLRRRAGWRGVFQVFQGLFLLQMKLDAQFILRADESGEDELVAFYGPSLEDGHGVKGFRYFRMAGYVPTFMPDG